MSLKRILGIALASRMAGRGRRSGSFGSSALLGGLGYRRRPALRGKAGLAALGYMAYKEYRAYQARNPAPPGAAQAGTGPGSSSTGAGPSGTGATSRSGSGGLGGMVQGLMDKVGAAAAELTSRPGDPVSNRQGVQPEPSAPPDDDLSEDERAADAISDEKALLLLRAMITAAYADGAVSTDEREHIMGHIAEAGGDDEDRRVLQREIAEPKPLDELLAQVHDRETAEEFYLASSAAVDAEVPANRVHLETIRRRLEIGSEEAREIDELTA